MSVDSIKANLFTVPMDTHPPLTSVIAVGLNSGIKMGCFWQSISTANTGFRPVACGAGPNRNRKSGMLPSRWPKYHPPTANHLRSVHTPLIFLDVSRRSLIRIDRGSGYPATAGYRRFSFLRASRAVKRHVTVAVFALRARCQ